MICKNFVKSSTLISNLPIQRNNSLDKQTLVPGKQEPVGKEVDNRMMAISVYQITLKNAILCTKKRSRTNLQN
jgi:hypothetical protein